MSHLRSALYAGVLSSSLAFTSGAQSAATPHVLVATKGSSLTIRGSTTIGAKWHCSSTEVESRMAIVPRADSDSSAVADVRGVTIHLPVSALRCQSGAMERAMRKALKADRDSLARDITGRFEIFDELPPASTKEAPLTGALRVAGVERNVLLRSTVEPQSDGTLRVRSVVSLALSTFGITPPKVLWGAVRARDAITVEVDLRYPAVRRP